MRVLFFQYLNVVCIIQTAILYNANEISIMLNGAHVFDPPSHYLGVRPGV